MLESSSFLATVLATVLITAGCAGTDANANAPLRTAPDTVAIEVPRPPTELLDRFTYVWSQRVLGQPEAVVGQDDPRRQVVTGVRVEGEFVAPDRHRILQTRLGGATEHTTELIAIGSEAWLRRDEGPWQSISGAVELNVPGLSATSALNPLFLDEARIRTALVDLIPSSTSTQGDLEVTRFEFDEPRGPAVALLHIQPDAELAIEGEAAVAADSGVIVGWRLSAEGDVGQIPAGLAGRAEARPDVTLEIQFSLSDIDDPGVRIDAPKVS